MYLEKIQTPQDIKHLSIGQLEELAAEIRQGVLHRDSTVGGHVGPNLGIVEATVAMHYVFDAAQDRFVFDVSHQSYPHKMLTGRAYGYTQKERMQEISGYSSPAESPTYDTFELGHTSTSISLATGLQKARDMRGTHENIVVVIGDGSLSGGEALEGLDEAAELGTGIIIIVNDNEMSIAENHGGLYRNLARLRETNGQAETNLFTAMGLDYRYVADGNDLQQLISALSELKGTTRPTVLHIHTLKGKGYQPAETEKEQWHWSMPFDISTGKPLQEATGENYHDLTGGFLLEEMKHDPLLVAVTSGTPTVGGFSRDRRIEAGAQHVDVGIAEEQAVAMISGMATGGLRPVYNVYSTFIQRTYDQLAQDLAINHSPAVINVFLGSLYGLNDITHIGFFDIPMLTSIPGLTYLCPTCCEEYLAMERWAIQQTSGPVAIRVPGGPVVHSTDTFDADYSTTEARYHITQQGYGVALLGLGAFHGLALQTAQLLQQHGITATVVNPRYASSLDTTTLDSLAKTHHTIVTLEDGSLDGGFGQRVAAYLGPTTVRTRCYGIRKALYDRYDYQQLAQDNHLTPELIAEDLLKS